MGEIKQGYERTDIGIFPEDWKVVSLGELIEFRNGVNADKNAYGKGIPFINVLEVITKSHLKRADILGQVSLNNDLIRSFSVKHGDVLFNRTSETQEEVGLAAVYIDSDEVVFGGFVIRGRPLQPTIDALYSAYMLRAPFVRNQIIAKGQGAIRANIGQADLKQVLVPLPPIDEQRAIAEALSKIDAQIAALDDVIAKKCDIKQATMQKLLTGEGRLDGFSGEWVRKALGDIGIFFSGGTPSTAIPEYYNGNIPWITSSDLNKRLIFSVEGFISVKGLENSSARMVKENTLLIALYGATAGVVAITRIEAAINQAVLAFIPEANNVEYLFHKLSSMKDWIVTTYTQGGQPNLSGTIIKSIELLLPSENEQQAIAEILSDMDAEIAKLEEKRKKVITLKRGMMQELLTGRTRLV